jgi:hypothetical protein
MLIWLYSVREIFCPRVGLPVDDDVPDKTRLEQQIETSEDVETRFMSGASGGKSHKKSKQHVGRIRKP